jgi:PIN domain nuclease of toxin-antitoxin system
MNLLLDAHALLWYLAGDQQLSLPARRALDDQQNQKWVGAATLWEIALKVAIGKPRLSQPFGQLFPELLRQNAIEILPIGVPHLSRLLTLPNLHKDPLDRILVAQASTEHLTLVTRDRQLAGYPVETLW